MPRQVLLLALSNTGILHWGNVIFKQGVCLTVVSFPLLQIVHSRTATALCLTSVKNEDKHDFSKIVEAVKVH